MTIIVEVKKSCQISKSPLALANIAGQSSVIAVKTQNIARIVIKY